MRITRDATSAARWYHESTMAEAVSSAPVAEQQADTKRITRSMSQAVELQATLSSNTTPSLRPELDEIRKTRPITRAVSRGAELLLEAGLGKTARKAPLLGDLPDIIHPIFRPNKMLLNGNIEPELVRPALILATKFITTPALLPFWYTLFFSDVRRVDYELYSAHYDTCGFEAFEYCDTPQELTPEQVNRTQEAFLYFEYKVCYSAVPPNLARWVNFSGLMTRLAQDSEPGAETAFVFISQDAIRDYRKGLELTERTWDPSFFALTAFELAKSLVHELANAVRLIYRGPGDFYFPTSAVDEEGFVWESEIFGGLVVPELVYPDDMEATSTALPTCRAELFAWPPPAMVVTYIIKKNSVGLRVGGDRPLLMAPLGPDAGGDAEAGMFSKPYDVSLFERMFTKAFWERDVAERGVNALRSHHAWKMASMRLPFWGGGFAKVYGKRKELLERDLQRSQAMDDSRECETAEVVGPCGLLL